METIIRENRPNIKPITLTSYLQKLKHISNNIGRDLDTPTKIMNNIDKIVEYLNSVSSVNARARASAVLAMLDNKKYTKKRTEVLKTLRNSINKYKVEKKPPLGEFSFFDTSSDMTWNDIMEKYKELEKEVSTINIECVLPEEFEKLKLYTILSCYVLIPPRRSKDYLKFKLKGEDDNFNYMTRKGRKKKYYFVFNTYKTEDKYGKVEIEIPDRLACIMKMWIMVNKTEWLCINKSMRKPLDACGLNRILNNFLGDNIGTTQLRKLYVSNAFTEEDKKTYKKMKELAEKMAHSVHTQQTYYMKH